jgi:uncharacterized glyoxalase superfamily protein PhnB
MPQVNVKGEATYSDFWQKAFGAVGISRSPGAGGKLMLVDVRIGASILMLAHHFSQFGAPTTVEGNYPDVDVLWHKVVAAGCTQTTPLSNALWGG